MGVYNGFEAVVEDVTKRIRAASHATADVGSD